MQSEVRARRTASSGSVVNKAKNETYSRRHGQCDNGTDCQVTALIGTECIAVVRAARSVRASPWERCGTVRTEGFLPRRASVAQKSARLVATHILPCHGSHGLCSALITSRALILPLCRLHNGTMRHLRCGACTVTVERGECLGIFANATDTPQSDRCGARHWPNMLPNTWLLRI